MKKMFLLLICLVLLTGCSVDYNIKIDKDLKVIEELSISESDSYFDEFYLDSHSTIINRTLSIENEDGISNKELLNKNNYKYQLNDNGITISKEYINLKDFSENTIFKFQPFKTIEYFEENGIVTIIAKDFVEYDPECIGQYDVDHYRINIESEYPIVDSNADNISSNKDNCSWIIDLDKEDFELKLSIDTKEKIVVKYDEDTKKALLYGIILFIGLVAYFIYSKKSVK